MCSWYADQLPIVFLSYELCVSNHSLPTFALHPLPASFPESLTDELGAGAGHAGWEAALPPVLGLYLVAASLSFLHLSLNLTFPRPRQYK